MNNTTEEWVISGEAKDAIPEIGKVYEIRDTRKGTFTGRVLSVNGSFAQVERLSGKIRWMSVENQLFVGNEPDTVSIRACLVYMIPLNNGRGNEQDTGERTQ